MWLAVTKFGHSSPDTYIVLTPTFNTLEEVKTYVVGRLIINNLTEIVLLIRIDIAQTNADYLAVTQSIHLNHLGRTFWLLETPRLLQVFYNPFHPSP